jgi:hypothetical protein
MIYGLSVLTKAALSTGEGGSPVATAVHEGEER